MCSCDTESYIQDHQFKVPLFLLQQQQKLLSAFRSLHMDASICPPQRSLKKLPSIPITDVQILYLTLKYFIHLDLFILEASNSNS